MTKFRDAPEHQGESTPDLAAAEYRLLADSLLNCINAEAVQDERLGGLVDHLYVLAVQADRTTAKNQPPTR